MQPPPEGFLTPSSAAPERSDACLTGTHGCILNEAKQDTRPILAGGVCGVYKWTDELQRGDYQAEIMGIEHPGGLLKSYHPMVDEWAAARGPWQVLLGIHQNVRPSPTHQGLDRAECLTLQW